ncbi:MAG: YitT family protein, partial [Bacteroidales bacterium]|nr:YitT family protein [Bacteroidales bacterium]
MTKEKIFSKQWFFSYFLVFIGSLLFAVGDVMFVNPYLMAPGGTYGLSNVLNAIWPWKISLYAICMDIPLLIIGTLI